jgi:hypothetical protein
MRPFASALVLLALLPAGAAADGAHKRRGQAAPAPLVHVVIPGAGLALSYPRGWHRPARLTKIIYPRERLALASYPLPRNDTIGECQARRSLKRIPPDGVFIYLLEFRPPRGKVWAEIRRRDFPPRPTHFRITRRNLQRNMGCYQGPSYALMFRAAGRPFRLFVAFGNQASDMRIAQAEAVLNSLRFRPLPPPPPDPYAGWQLLTTESGDSLRPPPGWPASATFMPRSLPRPRPLFFASNLPLPGLPARLVKSVKELPTPFPSQALAAFPAAEGRQLSRVPGADTSLADGPLRAGELRTGAAVAEPQLAARGQLVSRLPLLGLDRHRARRNRARSRPGAQERRLARALRLPRRHLHSLPRRPLITTPPAQKTRRFPRRILMPSWSSMPGRGHRQERREGRGRVSVRKLDACLLERAHDRLAGGSTHPSSWPVGAVRVEHADPYVAVMVAFKPNVDVPLARVGFEQVEHQQAWPFGHHPLLLLRGCDAYKRAHRLSPMAGVPLLRGVGWSRGRR